MSFKYPKYIAHRGASAVAPENTLKAFREAKRLGASMVEFDVGLCADGVPVIIHDDTVNRTTNGRGRVLELALADLRMLDAGEGQCISTLGEVLSHLAKWGLLANIEIKPCIGVERQTVRAVLQDVSCWAPQLPAVVISSFSMEVLREVRRHNADVMLSALFDELPKNWEKQIANLGCISVSMNQKYIRAEEVVKIKSLGYQVLCYTAETIQEVGRLFAAGVDGVFVNDPSLEVRLRK